MSCVEEVPIDSVIVGPNRLRRLGDFSELAASIAELGLLHPIVIGPGGVLIAGLHRLHACKSLGLTTILASRVDLDEIDRRLAEIDENLIDNELTVLERAEHLAERKRLYEKKHPPAKHGGDRRSSLHNADSIASFADDTATRTGRSANDVQREVKIANSLTNETRERVRGTPLEDRKVDLIKLSRVAEEDQASVVEKVVSGEARNVTAAVQQVKREQRLAQRSTAGRSLDVREGDAVALLSALPDGSLQCVVTDPPYGIDTHRTREGGHDYADGDGYALDLLARTSEQLALKCAPGSHLYVFSGYTHAWAFREILAEHFEVRENPLVWVKSRQTIAYPSSAKFANRYELIWFCCTRGDVIGLNDHETDVLEYAAVSPSEATGHSAEKPVPLLSRLIDLSTAPGELVCDPFCGSGSTGEAASKLGRSFLGIELDPKWAEVARARAA